MLVAHIPVEPAALLPPPQPPVLACDPGQDRGVALPQALQALVTTLEGRVALATLRQGKSRPTLSIS